MRYLSSTMLSLVLLGIWGCTDLGVSCPAGVDCAGECGGSAIIDCAGTCNGGAILDGANCTNISYSATIQPIFTNNCTSNCHNGSHMTGLDLSSYSGLIAGSTARAVIVPSDSSAGILLQYVKSQYMPPSGTLSSTEINRIATWIQEGGSE